MDDTVWWGMMRLQTSSSLGEVAALGLQTPGVGASKP